VCLVHEEDRRPRDLGHHPQRRVLTHERLPFRRVRFEQPFLWLTDDEAQSVQVVQTTAPAQRDSEPLLAEGTDHLPVPVPVSRLKPSSTRRRLHGRLQLAPLHRVKGGGEPPVGSKVMLVGPSRQNRVRHSPTVCGSRSSAAATLAAVHPCANSHSACHRSRSRGVGARYTSVLTAGRPSCHRTSACVISPSFMSAPCLHATCHPATAGFTVALV